MLVGLVEGVVGVGEHVVDEVLEEAVLEVELEVIPEDLVGPEGRENLVGALAVLELLVELVGTACVGDPAVEPDQPKCEVPNHHLARPQLLVDHLGPFVPEQHVEHLYELGREVGVGDDVLLAEEEAGQLQNLPNVLLPHHPQVVLLQPHHRHVVLAHQAYQQLRQEVDQLAGLAFKAGSPKAAVVDPHPAGEEL